MKYDETTDRLFIHQSDIKSFAMCPEQFRVKWGIQADGSMNNDQVRGEADAALIGTCFHAVVEEELRNGGIQLNDLLELGRIHYAESVVRFAEEDVPFSTASYGTLDGAIAQLDVLVAQWYGCEERQYWLSMVHEHPNDIEIEWTFEVPFLQLQEGRYTDVWLSGTADVLDKVNHRLVDWKTSGRKWQHWEVQRWDPQPSVYTYAAASQHLIEAHAQGYRFDFRVFPTRPSKSSPIPHELTVYRSSGQWGWLTQKVHNMLTMMNSGLSQWPLSDDGWWCGEKWCPVWSECKGALVSEDWT